MISGLISVVVINWNGMDYVAECLDSILQQTHVSRELIVVDNGSTDGSLEWLRHRSECGFRLVNLGTNLGFAGGANAGIRDANGEFVALLNNDAVADRNWLTCMTSAMNSPDTGMVASKILFQDRPDTIDKAGHLFYPDGLNRGRGAGDIDRGQFDHDPEIFFPDGCAALYRRSMLEEVGMFDDQFFAYGDDADLGLRARWRGWKCAYAPGARVYHRHSSSLGKYSPEKAFLVERNRVWVAVKLLPWPVLMLSPFFTLWRYFWHASSILTNRGLAGGVARDHGAWDLLRATLRAYTSGFAGLGDIIRKRREVFRSRKLNTVEFLRLLLKYRISAKELAFRD